MTATMNSAPRGRTSPLASAIRATAVSADAAGRSPAAVSPVVAEVTAGAVEDAASRTVDAAGRPATVLDPVSAAVVKWATAEGLNTVDVPYTPVSPAGAPRHPAPRARRRGHRARHRPSALGRPRVAVRVAGLLPLPRADPRPDPLVGGRRAEQVDDLAVGVADQCGAVAPGHRRGFENDVLVLWVQRGGRSVDVSDIELDEHGAVRRVDERIPEHRDGRGVGDREVRAGAADRRPATGDP